MVRPQSDMERRVKPFWGPRCWFLVPWDCVMFPPEPPVAITSWPERRAAVKGAPFGAAK